MPVARGRNCAAQWMLLAAAVGLPGAAQTVRPEFRTATLPLKEPDGVRDILRFADDFDDWQ
jgi:hypothetical protein